MSSPCLGISDLLQNPSMRCFEAHPMWKVSYKKEIEVRHWTQFLDVDKRGNQDTIPAEHVVSQIQDSE